MIFEIIFWVSLLALIHSYIIFPIILLWLSRGKKEKRVTYSPNEALPYISVIMAVHNEGDVIAEKLKTIYYTSYPMNNFEILIGSDCSIDETERLINIFGRSYDNLKLIRFNTRQGKPKIINSLILQAKGDIVIITDANVYLEFSTLYELIKDFKDPAIGLVDTRIMPRGHSGKGISVQEISYAVRESAIKRYESLVFGSMMGPFGGCYAFRRELFEPIPDKFLVDDFFINMSILSKGYKAVSSLQAFVSEDVSISMKEEFRRKVRIAAGNFQNLARYASILLKPFSPVGFCFLSHKVIRWIGPLLILLVLISNIVLIDRTFYKYFIIIQILFFVLPLADLSLRIIKKEVVFLRFITHFLSMNLAMLFGFIKYIRGVKSNIWQPTRRNQSE
jgi:cellulose synthase/poly-beta-1,6-N-acetylglucosamine synthase-like glycosyltransferase